MDRVGWGIVGAGGIAKRRMIPALLKEEHSEIIAVMKRHNPETLAKEFGIPFATDRLEDILSHDDIDAIYIATPVHLHKEEVIRAAEAGKHILCEKPLALNARDAEEMVAACKRHGVKFQVAFMMHYHGAHRKIAELIKAGKIGKPVYARAQLSCWYPPIEGAWRQIPDLGGGGSLIDMAPHLYDLLETFLGPIHKVLALTGNLVQNYPVEDSATTILQFESGVQATVDTFFNIPDEASKTRLEIYGSKGAILTEGTMGQDPGGSVEVLFKEEDSGYDPMQNKGDTARFVPLDYEKRDLFLEEAKAFVDALIEDKPIIENSGESGIHSMRIVDAVYLSARSGCFQEV